MRRLGITAAGCAWLILGGCGGSSPGHSSAEETGTTDGGETGDESTDTGVGDETGGDACEQDDPFVAVASAALPADEVGLGEVVVAGDYVYACSQDGGVTVWSVDGDSLSLVASGLGPDNLPVGCKRIAKDPDAPRIAISRPADLDGPGYVWVYDVTDPAAIKSVAGLSGDSAFEGVAITGDRIYVAARDQGLLVFEDEGMGVLSEVGSFADEDSDARKPVLVDGLLVVAEGTTGLRTYQADAQPGLVGTLGLGGLAQNVVLNDDTAYIATMTGVVAVDIFDPGLPKILHSLDTPGIALDVDVGPDDVMFVADWAEVRAWDMGAEEPTFLFSQRVPSDGTHARVRGVATIGDGRVAVGELSGLAIYEHQVTDCERPELAVSREVVRFDALEGVSSREELVLIENEGPGTLEVTDIRSSAPGVTADLTSFTLEAGEKQPVELKLTEEGEVAGVLTIESNDVDESELLLPFEGAHTRVDIGDPAPDFVMVGLDGDVWRESDLPGHATLLAYFATW